MREEDGRKEVGVEGEKGGWGGRSAGYVEEYEDSGRTKEGGSIVEGALPKRWARTFCEDEDEDEEEDEEEEVTSAPESWRSAIVQGGEGG